MRASSLGFGLICALTVSGIRAAVYFTSNYKWLSVRNNSVEMFGIAGKPDGGIRAFDAIAHCPADGGCKTIYVPAGTTFYSTDGGVIGVYR